jgi:ABC-type lipoprotein export system ATPase subunit
MVSHGFSRGRRGAKRWVQAFENASFDVQRGEVVAIVGSRLSGKTTLLSCMAGQRVPEAGSVMLGDVELSRLSERKRAKLRQDGLVWVNRAGMSQKLQVTKIVGWPLVTRRCGCRDTEQRAAEMLERVGAAHCARQRWDDLSRWEQVLVGLAQGFALRAPLTVVIDDLLDALGEPWTRQASDLLRSLIEDADRSCGIVMSVSDRDSALYADRVWALENGSLIPTAGHRNEHAEVVPLRTGRESRESRRVSWS